jgi:hypothetical protein
MWRHNILTLGLGVIGALVIGTFGPWGQAAKDNVGISFASDSSYQVEIMTDMDNNPTQLATVVPPYIILGDRLDLNEPLYQQPEIRVALNDMEGFYLEARASNLASNMQPIMFARSTELVAFSELQLTYSD